MFDTSDCKTALMVVTAILVLAIIYVMCTENVPSIDDTVGAAKELAKKSVDIATDGMKNVKKSTGKKQVSEKKQKLPPRPISMDYFNWK